MTEADDCTFPDIGPLRLDRKFEVVSIVHVDGGTEVTIFVPDGRPAW
jgi:hypothetical protein